MSDHDDFIRAQQCRPYRELPLVYACSGCSSAAQLANTLAVALDRNHLAEMSCIAGVGGDVRSLVKTARTSRDGRKVMVLDGCPLACARECLARQGVAPDVMIQLSEHGVKKRYHEDAPEQERVRIMDEVVLPALQQLSSAT